MDTTDVVDAFGDGEGAADGVDEPDAAEIGADEE
jgi:hypothetical protein